MIWEGFGLFNANTSPDRKSTDGYFAGFQTITTTKVSAHFHTGRLPDHWSHIRMLAGLDMRT